MLAGIVREKKMVRYLQNNTETMEVTMKAKRGKLYTILHLPVRAVAWLVLGCFGVVRRIVPTWGVGVQKQADSHVFKLPMQTDGSVSASSSSQKQRSRVTIGDVLISKMQCNGNKLDTLALQLGILLERQAKLEKQLGQKAPVETDDAAQPAPLASS